MTTASGSPSSPHTSGAPLRRRNPSTTPASRSASPRGSSTSSATENFPSPPRSSNSSYVNITASGTPSPKLNARVRPTRNRASTSESSDRTSSTEAQLVMPRIYCFPPPSRRIYPQRRPSIHRGRQLRRPAARHLVDDGLRPARLEGATARQRQEGFGCLLNHVGIEKRALRTTCAGRTDLVHDRSSLSVA